MTIPSAILLLLIAVLSGTALADPPKPAIVLPGEQAGQAPIPVTPRILPQCPVRLGGVYTSGLGEGPTLAKTGGATGKLSVKNRDWIAANCDVIALNASGIDTDTFPALVKASRLFTPLLYVSASSLSDEARSGSVGAWKPEMAAWTLRDKEGKEVPHPDAGSHWMDFDNKEWAAYWSRQAGELTKNYGAYGVVAAELPLGNTFAGDNLLKYKTVGDRAKATLEWLKAARPGYRNLLIPSAIGFDLAADHHTVEPNNTYFAPELSIRLWNDYYPLTDGAWCEGWLQPYWTDKPASQSLWETQIEAADRAGRSGQVFIACAAYHNNQELEFALASYLMAAHNQGRLVFQPMPVRAGEPADEGFSLAVLQREVREKPDYFRIPLGVAMQERHLVPAQGGAVWRRNYQFGDVYVNSSERKTVTILFSGKLRRLNGTLVSRITLPPHTGAVLRYTGK